MASKRSSNRKKLAGKKTVTGGSKPMRITSRIVNAKRHTVGYMIDGKVHTVALTKRLAGQGRISGVRVVGNHVQSENGRRRLSDLPMKVK